MNINISLDKNFTTQYNRMQNDYGSEMAELNGFSDNQLSYTDFIDNFVDEDTVADASIDGNSNVSHKDIVTLEREMPKPHSKLLAFNKIYYEIQKKYGFKAANEWLKEEWIGDLYLHDASSSTFRHYCFTGDTKIITDNGIKTLKSIEGKDVKVLNKNHTWEDAKVQYFGNQRIYNLVLERYGIKKEIKVTPEHVWFVRESSGCTEVQTRNLKKGMNIPYNSNETSSSEHKDWVVISVSDTGKDDDVYCAVVPGTQSFTLDGNILTHNCFAYDLKDLAEKGLYFIEGRNSSPAKHLITFVDFVKEFVSYAANRSSGAVGLPNLIPYMYYFWKKDVDDGYLGLNEKTKKQYAMQNFQRFIYAVNQPYCRDGSQSAFTNTSVFDHPYFEALFGGSVFPDGTPMIDCEDDIIEFQKWYMEKMSDIRSENMFTFPVKLIAA